ncbi:expressed unknown protein [Seminavis robusta]|uniref:Uncharacterized protein n=1 Tax=Seminavis robusta TaxID=568900 RepID=A0A9N8H558_9STRA|nr:expressed unknown protein [Seminavis robusta]|eukprot:Sro78_g042370.1 n/a (140) ;mRNA; r:42696-43115
MKLLNNIFVSLCLTVLTVAAFNIHDHSSGRTRQCPLQATLSDTNNNNGGAISRAQWLQLTLATTLLSSTPAFAKDVDPALKGTKKDPEFESCLSQCMYDCTKPKGVEQKSRSECLPECKSKCATTKAQLLKGLPLEKAE